MRQLFLALFYTGACLTSIIGIRPAKAPAQEPVKNSPRPKNDAVNVLYYGTVTALTKTSITVQGPVETPKEFLLSEALATGKVATKPRIIPTRPRGYLVPASFMYRIADVKVGDLVIVSYACLGDADICDHICIDKRPGGRVPPLPKKGEAFDRPEGFLRYSRPDGKIPKKMLEDFQSRPYIPYHEWRNAHWDLVDKGIPYPEKFGEKRRWPQAPMPREVK
jgi:hypothetical protein